MATLGELEIIAIIGGGILALILAWCFGGAIDRCKAQRHRRDGSRNVEFHRVVTDTENNPMYSSNSYASRLLRGEPLTNTNLTHTSRDTEEMWQFRPEQPLSLRFTLPSSREVPSLAGSMLPPAGSPVIRGDLRNSDEISRLLNRGPRPYAPQSTRHVPQPSRNVQQHSSSSVPSSVRIEPDQSSSSHLEETSEQALVPYSRSYAEQRTRGQGIPLRNLPRPSSINTSSSTRNQSSQSGLDNPPSTSASQSSSRTGDFLGLVVLPSPSNETNTLARDVRQPSGNMPQPTRSTPRPMRDVPYDASSARLLQQITRNVPHRDDGSSAHLLPTATTEAPPPSYEEALEMVDPPPSYYELLD